MLGAIIGDIIGSQYKKSGHKLPNFKLFTNQSTYTDETICTVAIAEAVINGIDYTTSLTKWYKKYPAPKIEYGNLFKIWLENSERKPYHSWGNGAATRVSAIGWAFDSLQKTLKEAERSANITHNHPEGTKSAVCIAALIYLLRKKKLIKDDIPDWLDVNFEYHLPEYNNIKASMIDSCMETIPVAIQCFLEANNFENTIRKAVEIGGNTDTTASIAGAIAEAYYVIPKEIKQKAISYLPNDIKAILAEFFAKFR